MIDVGLTPIEANPIKPEKKESLININCKFGLAELGMKPVSVDLEGESL